MDTDILDDPETVFRRWNNKEEGDLKVDKSKYTPDSSPVRHPNQVVSLLSQEQRDRRFDKTRVGVIY